MNEKQMFSVFVRALGVLAFVKGLTVFWFAYAQWGIPATAQLEVPLVFVAPSLLYGLFAMALGTTMIRWPG